LPATPAILNLLLPICITSLLNTPPPRTTRLCCCYIGRDQHLAADRLASEQREAAAERRALLAAEELDAAKAAAEARVLEQVEFGRWLAVGLGVEGSMVSSSFALFLKKRGHKRDA